MIKNLSSEEVLRLNIPTGIPYVFRFDNKLKLVNDCYIGNQNEIAKKTILVSSQASSKLK